MDSLGAWGDLWIPERGHPSVRCVLHCYPNTVFLSNLANGVLIRCHLFRIRFRFWRKLRLRRLCLRMLCASLSCALIFVLLWFLFPFDANKLGAYPASRRLLDSTGDILRVYDSSTGEMRFPVSLMEISPWLREATVAVEDQRFWTHPGVDVVAAGRATWQNISRFEVHSGASTLTMQLVRIVDQRPRTLVAKIVEAFHALQITASRSKEETLCDYLNLAPYGGNLRGVEAAALRYFGKRAGDLSLAEAALLAGLPQSPSRLRPDRHYEAALARQRVVLDAMLREAYISADEHREAVEARPPVGLHPWPFRAPHFAELALREANDHEANDLLTASRKTSRVTDVRTTLDSGMQRAAESHLRAFFEPRPTARLSLGGAVVVIEVATGSVRALAGSPDFFDVSRRGQVNGADSLRSPGSSLKPFLFALAFDRGATAPSAYLADVPTPYVAYVPENFDRRHHGPVSAAKALSLSLNIPAVRLLERVGTARFLRTLKAAGFSSLDRGADHYGLTLTLGGGEVKLLELVDAYAAFPRLGLHRPCRFLASASEPKEQRVFSEAAATLILDALSDTDHVCRVRGRRRSRAEPVVGFKTGTSFGFRDAWAVAFSTEWVVGVWIGDPRGKPHRDLVGVRAAAPVALAILEELSPDASGAWPRPDDILERDVCSTTGYPAGSHCPATRKGLFPAHARELPTCRVHRRVMVDEASGVELCSRCRQGHAVTLRVVEEWPPEVTLWLDRRGGLKGRFPHNPACTRIPESSRRPKILSPTNGGEYQWLSRAPFQQNLHLIAAVAPGVKRVHWFVDGVLFASGDASKECSWPLKPGRHEMRCVDDHGRAGTSTITVHTRGVVSVAVSE